MQKINIFSFVLALMLIHSGVQAQITTNLPIVLITTPAAITAIEQQGSMSIIDNTSGINNQTDPATFVGMVGVRIRGNVASPKPSYNVETWSAPNVNVDTSLLGMPSDNDWVLLSSYNDRSLMRTTLTNRLHEAMGRYAPKMEHCELIVNGSYQGIYLFGEKIKKTAGRLDLATLNTTDNSGIELTGGYIWKIDDGTALWTSAFAPPYATTQQIKFVIDYPDAGDITPAQTSYIKAYVDSFETAMNASNFQDTALGWRRYGAVNAFIDYMIMNEVSRNYDAYRSNVFMYKDKEKKMRPGPVWGFDLAWRNTADCSSASDTGWCYQIGASCPSLGKLPPFWWSKLTTDVSFMQDLKCMYRDYRLPNQILDTNKIFMIIDSMKTRLTANNAVSRNFTQWPIWGVPLNNEPTPMATNFNEEVDALKQFIRNRLTWLDNKWVAGLCLWPVAINETEKNMQVEIFPNPASDWLTIQGDFGNAKPWQLEVLDLRGRSLYKSMFSGPRAKLDTRGFSEGIYLIRIEQNAQVLTRKLVIE